MPIIQITNTYTGKVLDIVKQHVPQGFTIKLLEENTKEALLENVAEADYILASGRVPIDSDVLDKASKLKMIQRTGVGLDSIALDELKKRNIPFYVNRGVNAHSVAEHAVMLILACLKKLPVVDANTKRGVWLKQAQGIQLRCLSELTVGIYGLGNIGRRVAELLKAFGCRISYFSVPREFSAEEMLGIEYVDRDELFEISDVITLHCPLMEQTRRLINKQTLSQMKDGVVIVNTARGGLIDEDDLCDALESGKVAFAGLDVYAREPVDNMRLLSQKNLIATSHLGGVTYDAFSKTMREAMRNIKCFEEGALEQIEDSRYRF